MSPPVKKIALALAPLWAAAGAASADSPPPLTNCNCTSSPDEVWALPSMAANASSRISRASNASQCWNLAKSTGGFTCDGVCVFLGACDDAATPTWQWADSGNSARQWLQVTAPAAYKGWCLDENTGQRYYQAYPNCNVGDTHQLWKMDANPGRVIELWTGTNSCSGVPGPTCPQPPPPPPPPPPAPPSEFCYAYHPIMSGGLYDPSGPLLTPDGLWHMWEDEGGWGHFTSKDLIHWDQGGPSTGFSGLTGSVAVTPAGAFAFYPEGSQQGVDMAVSTDAAGLSTWSPKGRVITAPAMAGSNFRDPLRAFQWTDGKWYVGVGCNNQSKSADLCLFQAADDTLSSFSFVGPMFTAYETYGQMDGDIVWRNVSVGATMMECPDVFALGDASTFMLIGSLYSTNQWWIGSVAGSPPRCMYPRRNPAHRPEPTRPLTHAPNPASTPARAP